MVRVGVVVTQLSKYVPPHKSVSIDDLLKLESFILNARKLFVMTGAGISTESGIRDYRSERVGIYAATNHRPVVYADFLRSAAVRQRYWARNTAAWTTFSSFEPNVAHQYLSLLERKNKLHWLVTQNVDRLHHKAGSTRITELHGSMFHVVCLGCNRATPRQTLQKKIQAENPNWSATPDELAPDGDVPVAEEKIKTFRPPCCDVCGGILKPDVVFFGDTVPKQKVDLVGQKLVESDSLLVVGSSLQTYSSYRHVHRGVEMGIPALILNIGPTRADNLADKIEGRIGEMFSWLLDRSNLL